LSTARDVAKDKPIRKSIGFGDVVGQMATLQRLRDFVPLYAQSGKTPGHVLLTGVDGIGKRTIARAFAGEYCCKLNEIDAKNQKKTGDIMGVLTNLGHRDALLLGDVGQIPKNLLKMFVPSLKEFVCDFVVDKGIFAKTIKVPLKPFTCIATARSKAECPEELVEAFPLIISLQSYSQSELARICEHLAHQIGIAITPSAADLLVGSSTGTPHDIELLVARLSELGKTMISAEDVAQVLSVLGIRIRGTVSASTGEANSLSGIDFEKVIAALLRAMGFQTELTEATGDGGIDIVATLEKPLIGGRYLIQCKRFALDNLVGAATIRDFYGAVTADRKAIKGVVITTSGFTPQALAFAQNLPIELVAGHQLRALLAQYGISSNLPSGPKTLFE